MIELKQDKLVFRFPEVHPDAVCNVEFQRTLRIPDDNREYHLPPGLGRFTLEHQDDHRQRLPESWNRRGGVLLPMYQAEAMWIHFQAHTGDDGLQYPFAIKIAAGKINAVTGESWANELSARPQDYVVIPDQPWLDGFNVQEGLVRQFVAMPLGAGYTAEEQITGDAEFGGLQIIAYPMKRERYEEMLRRQNNVADDNIRYCLSTICAESSMGLAPGGLMRQKIYEDDYGINAWDTQNASRCFVHIINSTQWTKITNKPMPSKPLSAADYTRAGLPWFDYYDEGLVALDGSKKLAGLDSVAAKAIKLGEKPLPDNKAVSPTQVVPIGPGVGKVSEGEW